MSQAPVRFMRVKMDKAERTPQGFLRVPAYLTRTGVFTYIMADGKKVRELRHPDDVWRPESISTLQAVPLTNEHPKKLVTPETAKAVMIGWVGDTVEKDMIYAKADVTVCDEKGISDIESGKRELSCGYTADLVSESGVYNGEPYDMRQTNIVYNHVSLVKRGRAGAMVKLHLDADAAVEFIEDEQISSEEGDNMKVKIGDKEYECSAELKDAFEKKSKEDKDMLDSLNTKMADMMPKADSDKLKAKADAAESSLADAKKEITELKAKADGAQLDQAKIDEAVKARVALISQAQGLVKADTKLDGLSDLDVKKAVLKEKKPTVSLDGKSDVYIESMYDIVVADAANDKAAQDALNKKTRGDGAGGKNNDAPVSSAEARKKMIADSKESFKTRSEFSTAK